MDNQKVIGWIIGILGLYGILSILVDSIPAVLEGTWGWVVSVVLLLIGIWIVYFKK